MVPSDKYFVNADGIEFDVALYGKNTFPLGETYNDYIEKHKNDEYDYMVLMHSDVVLDTTSFAKHIMQVHGKYDVIGLCGCSKIVASQSPLNWFCGSRPCPETRWGCVSHGEMNNQTSYFSAHSPNILDHEVSCIDGLCIVLSKSAIEKGLRFDPTIGDFDLYDTDLSFQALLNYKLKIGVVVQKELMHYSLGKSILNDKFLVNEYKFRQKWKLPIPETCLAAYQRHCSSN